MAMEIGLWVSKFIILLGAGYASTQLLMYGVDKLYDALGDREKSRSNTQSVVKGREKKWESAEGDTDDLASEVRRLAAEVRQFRQLASARQSDSSDSWPQQDRI